MVIIHKFFVCLPEGIIKDLCRSQVTEVGFWGSNSAGPNSRDQGSSGWRGSFNSTWSLGGLSGMAGCWFHCVDSKNARAFRRGKTPQIPLRLQHTSTYFNILQPWSKNEATSDISQSLRALNRVSAPIFGQLPHFGDPRMIPEVHIFF